MPATTWASARHVGSGSAGAGAACTPLSMRAFSPRRRTCTPAKERRAGVRVTAISTAIATDAAPMLPIRPRNGMPVTLSATRAMMTVAPAKTTALPEVPLASAMDSSTEYPSLSCRRCRLTMNSA